MATPSPAVGITEGLQNGPASSRFARELAQTENVKAHDLHCYDFGPGHNVALEDPEDLETSSSSPTLKSATSFVVIGWVWSLLGRCWKSSVSGWEGYNDCWGRQDPWCVFPVLLRIFHSARRRLALCRQRWNGIGYANYVFSALLHCSVMSVLNRPSKCDV